MTQLTLESKYKELQETEEGKERSAAVLLRMFNLAGEFDKRAEVIVGNTLTKHALHDAAKGIRSILAGL